MYQRSVMLTLPKAQTIDIEFADLNYERRRNLYGEKKLILKGISGKFKSGELTAVMGPSGSGKSTLLNILTGFEKKNWKGSIEYIGTNGKQTWKEYRKESCYIQQDDQLFPLFTVTESMWIATDLKIGGSLNRKAKQMLIDDILESLELTKVKDTRCKRLSGGQKKRVSIALELIDNPPVMFFDEPTTGLDSLSSMQCISILRNLAKSGRTIICTIHQPSAVLYEMFDHVYLLANGRCMYEGAAKNTIAFFGSLGLWCPKYHNPADYMIEVVCAEYGDFNDQLVKQMAAKDRCWRSNDSNTNKSEPAYLAKNEGKTTILIKTPTEIERLYVLTNRALLQLYRDWTVTHLKVMIHALVAIVLGLCYTNAGQDGSKSINNIGYFLITTVYLSYTSMMPAVVKFPLELPTLRKERLNNWYQLRTYYTANLICSIPLQMILAVVYSSISYFLSSQPMDPDRFLMFVATTVMLALVSETVGLVLGTLVNPVNGTFLGSIATCAMLLFAGFLILFDHMPTFLYYVSYLSYMRYGMHALVVSVYGFSREKLSCTKNYCHYRMPQKVMEDLSMADGKFWFDMVILLMSFVFLRFVAYCTLRRKLSTA